MKIKSETISFRCPVELARAIDVARKPFNISRGEWARTAVMAQIQHGDQRLLTQSLDDVSQRVMEVAGDLHVMSRNLSKATYLLLTNRGLGSEEAKELVTRVLGSTKGAT